MRKGFRLFLEETKTTIQSSNDLHIYPPCSGERDDFLMKCNGCEACKTACPHDAIIMKEHKHLNMQSLPIIEPELNPCYLCDDLPCVTVCEPGALFPEKKTKIGFAKVKQSKCFAFNGQMCDYCHDRCPNKDKAITMTDKKPVVNKDACTGCGICAYYCPAPGKGIVILPKDIKE